MGFPGAGNTQAGPTEAQESSAPSQHSRTHLLAKKATQGKRRSWVSTKTFCTKRFGVQLCCKGNREEPELLLGQGS